MNKLSDKENANLDAVLQSWKTTVQLDHALSDKVWSEIQTPSNYRTFAQAFSSIFTSPAKLVPITLAVVCSGLGLAQYRMEFEEEKKRHSSSLSYLKNIYPIDFNSSLVN